MNMDYSFNIDLAIKLASYASLIVVIFSLVGITLLAAKGRSVKEKFNNVASELYGSLPIIIFYPLVVFPTAFLIIAQITNIYEQNIMEVSFWEKEFKNGVIGLRIASLMLTIRLIISVVKISKNKKGDPFKKILKGETLEAYENNKVSPSATMEEVEAQLGPLDNKTRAGFFSNDIPLGIIAALQNSIYIIIISILWYYLMIGNTSILSAALSWGVLFIIDDWFIILDYLSANACSMVKSHKLRIWGFNALLILGTGMITFQVLGIIASIIFLVVTSALFFGIHMVYFVYNRLHTQAVKI